MHRVRALPRLSCALALCAGRGVVQASEQAIVRIHDDVVVVRGSTPSSAPAEGVASRAATVPILTPRAWHGEPVAGGGTLNPSASSNPANIDAYGRVAFFSKVDGVARNQGIFVADDAGLRAIVMGCGGGGGSGNPGGCGDPSPVGGTFAGLFDGTVFAPDINDSGDVLFMADVVNGSSPRGLFLYRNATGQIVKVAALGDTTPIGGRFIALGPGSLSNGAEVVFLGRRFGSTVVNIFRWKAGVVTKHAGVGDAAPEGGVFSAFSTELFGFADGSFIPVGPLPDINDAGQVSFRASVSGGSPDSGLIVSTSGVHQWYVRAGDPTPAGGTYMSFFAPVLNNAGQIAFFADYRTAGGEVNSGWFAGGKGQWRKALAFFDPLDGGECAGLAVSRNPMQPLDDHGDLVLWTSVALPSGGSEERLVINAADGATVTAVRAGDPSPFGGQVGSVQAWPSKNECEGTISSSTPGSGILNAHMLVGGHVTEVSGLLLERDAPAPGEVTMNWDSQDAAAGAGTRYDVARGDIAALHSGGFPAADVCEADDLPDTPYSELSTGCPEVAGNGCWYLVRAQNGCGSATYGPAELDLLSPCP